MSYETILYEEVGAVALITLNRPSKLNAWTPQMSTEQIQAIRRANDNPKIASIVMTGAGRGFCAGADMEETFQKRLDGEDPGDGTTDGSGGLTAGDDWIGEVRAAKPIIAAVNGAAVGIGLTMVLPCDLIIASEKARFGAVFVKVGIVPELASSHFLISRMGFGKASEMMLSGRLYGAAEAHEKGLADYVYPEETFLTEAIKLGETFAGNPDPMMRMTKELLTLNAVETDLKLIQRRETDLLKQCWELPEHHEAVNAFLEKRTAKFR
ncbi:MAG: enoyl-CoA hydratase/isomerase family protein [Alphaproteobacteria bacterium]